MSRIRKAIIPLAGLGTRHFPASHAVKKELFPVVGPDGIARALFHYHLLELEAAGIDQVCLIVQPGEETVIRQYLRGPDEDYLQRLASHEILLREAEHMRSLVRRVQFAVQTVQAGYGHAVYQAREFAGGDPVLLCLGDHLFRGRTRSPYRELCEVAAASGGLSISAVNRIGPDALCSYGTISGRRRKDTPRLIEVEKIIEKPPVELARKSLHVDGLPPDTWLGFFGLHVLSPGLFEVLDRMIRDEVRDGGEFQLTHAQELQREREGCLALEMTKAERFDFGVPDDYVKGLAAFRAGEV